MSKPTNNPLTTNNTRIASSQSSLHHLRQNRPYQEQASTQSENITDVTAGLVAENERRLSDLGGGIARAFSWLLGRGKKTTNDAAAPKDKPRLTFYDKLDQEIAKKPVKSELYIPKKDSYAKIPSPSLYDPNITVAEKTVAELRSSEQNITDLIRNGSRTYENHWQRGLDRFYLYSKRREITENEAHALEASDAAHDDFRSIKGASSDFTAAANLSQSNPLPLFYHGLAHLYDGTLKESLNYIKSAISLDSQLLWANHFLALSLNNRQTNLARRHYTIEMERNPNAYSLLQLAKIDFVEKKYDHALAKLQETEKLDPKARLVHLKMSEIYRIKGNSELELLHLNKELENAQYHRDQKLVNRVSRDLGYYHIRENNPHEALRLFDYAGANRMSHEKYSVTHLFDRANAIAAIENPQTAERDLLEVTRQKFIKSGILERALAAPVYYNSYKLLAEFRIKHYGFDAARNNLEESLKKSDEITNPTKEQSALKLSLKTELATLLFVHSKSITHGPEKSALLKESKDLISEESSNRSHQLIKEELIRLITSKERLKPETSPRNHSHHKLQPNISQAHSNQNL